MSFISTIRPQPHASSQYQSGANDDASIVAPPPCNCAIVLIGQNSRGQWVAQEQHALFGGLFTHRAAAFRYALFENGHHPEAIVELHSILELQISQPPQPAIHPSHADSLQ